MHTFFATGASPAAYSFALRICIASAALTGACITQAAEPASSSNTAAKAAVSAAELRRIDGYVADMRKGVGVLKRTLNKQGDSIDCVDILTQPGVRGMQSVQLEPSATLNAMLRHVTRPADSEVCPRGSVEMNLPTRAEVLASGGLDAYLERTPDGSSRRRRPPDRSAPATQAGTYASGHYWAYAPRTENNIGAQATISLWKPAIPKVAQSMADSQFSLSQIWVAGGGNWGGTGVLQTVEAGAHVYQNIANDVELRFFVYFTSDNYVQDHCYNLRCDAFVVTSSVLTPGAKLPASKPGSPSIEGTLAWYRDPESGNWFLFLHDTSNGYRHIGYYPHSRFGGGQMSRHANMVAFGGEIFAERPLRPTVPMGSGVNPLGYRGVLAENVAYQRGLSILSLDGVLRDVQPDSFTGTPESGCAFGIQLFPHVAPYREGWGTTVFFGGQGETVACPVK